MAFDLLLIALGVAGPLHAQSSNDVPLLLVNGKIITLDDRDTVAESVLIHRGRIVAVDDESLGNTDDPVG